MSIKAQMNPVAISCWRCRHMNDITMAPTRSATLNPSESDIDPSSLKTMATIQAYTMA